MAGKKRFRALRESFRRALALDVIDLEIRRGVICARRLFAASPPHTVGVLAIMKNETWILREWIDHYRWQGVDKIFLIDNGSTDNPRALIEDDIRSGFVEFYERPQRHAQRNHYREIFRTAKIARKVRWLVMADLDEFWYSPQSSLGEELRRKRRESLIYANWKVFGAAREEGHPRSIRESCVFRHPGLWRDIESKWIVRTDCVLGAAQIDVHWIGLIPKNWIARNNDAFHINHYILQSWEFFSKVKMTRGDVAASQWEEGRNRDYFDNFNREATLEDRALSDVVIAARRTPAEVDADAPARTREGAETAK